MGYILCYVSVLWGLVWFLLTYNTFQVYSSVIWYLYLLQTEPQSKSKTSITAQTHFNLVMRTFQIFSLCSFHTIVLFIVVTMLHNTSPWHSFYNCKFVPLTAFTHFAHSPPLWGFNWLRTQGWKEYSLKVKDEQQSGCFLCVCARMRAHAHVFSVSVVLVNSINVIFLALLFMIWADRIWQIMWEEFLNSISALTMKDKPSTVLLFASSFWIHWASYTPNV